MPLAAPPTTPLLAPQVARLFVERGSEVAEAIRGALRTGVVRMLVSGARTARAVRAGS